MPQRPVIQGVKLLIKEWMISYGPKFNAMDCLKKFEEIELRSTNENQGIKYPIYHSKTYQLIMKDFKDSGIFNSNKSYDLHAPFKYSTSIGDGVFQIQLEHTKYATETMDYYLTTFGQPCSIGFVQEYIKVCLTDPDWTNVQQKSLYAEIFWIHRILNDIEKIDSGSVEYEERCLMMRIHNILPGQQVFDFDIVEMRFEENERYKRFRSIINKEGLKPWSQTKRNALEYIGLMPQFNAAQDTNISGNLTSRQLPNNESGRDEFENMRKIVHLPPKHVSRLIRKLRGITDISAIEALIAFEVDEYYQGRNVNENERRDLEERFRIRFSHTKSE
ncbi:MAG: hypothetical protein ACJ0A3_00135 [Dehalococcoidia bacterium]